MPRFESCPNCGAHLAAGPDGRTVECAYCGATDTRAVDPGRLAAALQAEAGSVATLFENLAARLEREMPDLARVTRSGGLLTAKKVQALEVDLGTGLFRLRRDGSRIVAEHAHVVRGIVLKNEALPVDVWLVALCEALSLHAGASAQTLEALRRLGR
jgi:hypothetical protein